jgi:hypothetical protein
MPVTDGQAITVTAKSGKSWPARAAKVVWHNDEIAIVATASTSPRRGRGRGGCGCDCDDCSPCRCEPHCNCRGGNIYDCG